MKKIFVMFVLCMWTACTGVEQSRDDRSPTVTSDESALVDPGAGTNAFCGFPSDPPCPPGMFCAGGICKPPGGPNAFCGASSDPPCRAGLFCAGGLCKPPGGPGAFCGASSDPPCRAGLFCSGGICR